ncbi:fumarylacetoacetate hydrolase family protein [Actinokineospora bangkokensis]|uniref:Fumarylacetoacetase-like C-terminal domain-containing protein n=1 Tax=Actinokineospora bangkokensis TaxID=1193682 RepID=A0A1Q9LIJ9_9PSEU|nr:fumarylacetoacetate hydrolase family protein [Actinokineospora bangkokensis]OLR91871.1 hypothetical protein BJP25_23850 [Actinokineospora bangkokensis]
MKLASTRVDGAVRVIADRGDGVALDVNDVLDDPAFTIDRLLDLDEPARAAVVDTIASHDGHAVSDLRGAVWLPPVARPSKIVGVALNNDVFNYLAVRKMSAPMYFLAPSTSMVGHGGAIEVDPAWGLVHPEPELGAVIGAPLRHAGPDQALDAVFGYTIVNDVTSPGLKAADSVELVMPEGITVDEPWRTTRGDDDRSLYLTYHARSKGTDTFTPIGPWITLRDDVPDPNDLEVRAYLDDTLVLLDSTANLTFPVERVLSHLSRSMTLLPGDVVHFGTAARPADPDRFATIRAIDLTRHGDTVSVEVDRIGRLDNVISRTTRA